MIIHQSKGSWGSRLSVLQNSDGTFTTISTAKEGLLKPLSTMIMRGKPPSVSACGKVVYSPSLRKVDRQNLHDIIAGGIDGGLNVDGFTLGVAIEMIVGEMRKSGVIAELINLAVYEEQAGEGYQNPS
jgi:hypothetical protein